MIFFTCLQTRKKRIGAFLSTDHDVRGWVHLVPFSEMTTPDLDLVTQALLHISCLLLPGALGTKRGAQCPVRQLFSYSQCSISCCGLFIWGTFEHNYRISRLVWSFFPKIQNKQSIFFLPSITMKLLFFTCANHRCTELRLVFHRWLQNRSWNQIGSGGKKMILSSGNWLCPRGQCLVGSW